MSLMTRVVSTPIVCGGLLLFACSAHAIDLTGACNSEHMLGHQYSASGGQLDFVRGAYASKGGK